jgi:hypothetical protein
MGTAQTPPGMRLPGADRDLARAESGQWLRSRMPQELLQRQPKAPLAVQMRITQPYPHGADRARAAFRQADGLATVPVTGRPGSDELPVAQVALRPGFPAGVAESVGHPPLAGAAPDKAEPVSQQRMARPRRESLGPRRSHTASSRKACSTSTHGRPAGNLSILNDLINEDTLAA